MNKGKILIIGPLPPPAGGVSIHIHRLSHVLKKKFTVSYLDESKAVKKNVYNIRSFNLVKYFRLIMDADLLYIHSGSNILRIVHMVTAALLGKKTLLTIHSYPAKKGKAARLTDQFFFSLATRIIVVNQNILDRISLPPQKCVTRHAFLPPIMTDEPELPAHLRQWIADAKMNGKTVICANAWRLDTFNNQDVYGLDLCIEVADRLLKKGIPVAVIFNVSTIDNLMDVYLKNKRVVEQLHIEHSFLLINEKLSFVRLMEEADIVLRPTNTDGDSLTIREALMLGKPIIASDVVQRPAGTLLFKCRDTDDLEKKLQEVILTPVGLQKHVTKTDPDVYADFYNDLAEQLLH